MLKIIGHFYSDNEENFAELETALTESGYTLAFYSPLNAEVLKEVDSLTDDTADTEDTETTEATE